MKIIYISLILILCVGCRSHNCDNDFHENFDGEGLIFFHYPVSGSVYQVLFVPLCEINNEDYLNSLIENGTGNGITFDLVERSYITLLIKKSTKYKLEGVNKNFDPLYKEVNVLPVKLKYSKAVNNTSYYGGEAIANADYNISGKKIKIKYFITDDFRLDTLKLLK